MKLCLSEDFEVDESYFGTYAYLDNLSKAINLLKPLILLERATRVELATFSLGS